MGRFNNLGNICPYGDKLFGDNKMEKRKIATISVIAIIALLSLGILVKPQVGSPESAGVTESIGFDNSVRVYKNGVLVATGTNAVTNWGMNHTRDALTGNLSAGAAALDTLELSTNATSPVVTDGTCPQVVSGNGLGQVIAGMDWEPSHFGNFSVQWTWTATGTQSGIAKVCLTNGTSNDILFASSVLSSVVNAESGDALTVKYFVKPT